MVGGTHPTDSLIPIYFLGRYFFCNFFVWITLTVRFVVGLRLFILRCAMTRKTPSKATKKPLNQKQKLIRLVHVGKGKLGWDDGTYREALEVVTGKSSSKACTVTQLKAFVRHLESKGFVATPPLQPSPKRGSKKATDKNHTLDKPDVANSKKPQVNKIEALLAEGGKPWAYAQALAMSMYKVEYLTWCDARQLQGIITALVKQNEREAKAEKY